MRLQLHLQSGELRVGKLGLHLGVSPRLALLFIKKQIRLHDNHNQRVKQNAEKKITEKQKILKQRGNRRR